MKQQLNKPGSSLSFVREDYIHHVKTTFKTVKQTVRPNSLVRKKKEFKTEFKELKRKRDTVFLYGCKACTSFVLHVERRGYCSRKK